MAYAVNIFFTPYSSHLLLSIFSPKNADPIGATNLYINECTGVTQDWKNFGQYGIYVDGNVSLFKFILSQKRVFIKIWTLLNTTITNSGNYDKSYFCLLVDHSHCGLTKVSRVITWMTCSNNCLTAMGSDKLYNQNNNGFRVYLNQPIEWKNDRAQTPSSPIQVNQANIWKWKLHYEVKGICNEIPGSSWDHFVAILITHYFDHFIINNKSEWKNKNRVDDIWLIIFSNKSDVLLVTASSHSNFGYCNFHIDICTFRTEVRLSQKILDSKS